ncbi:Diacylglycerol kinase catalytic region [Candidatus Filomicrobium marinum]|uniref:Diacylglycerol kinase catalytic region n=1 Tax=Candidatus Filomicrobium marinum TaxID=1608628 RepID=A0A0D6JK30_9HYPH|nr:diacylglycerol kinase family protein [Candidatus Filomicrobium marinum]CFX31940.1 Diacylglycerol kinase catalytic region [Candidatus Filomicrobium marinum]CPR21995.1 Diacylglycerol kinase catalytic region [Candidatus Filomicrobium marinum]
MRTHTIVNCRAGTALDLSPRDIEKKVAQAFRDGGHETRVECVEPEKLVGAISAAAQGDIDALIIGGGDGSVRSAAEHLIGTNKALGVLPLGTMNRFARDLNLPLEIDAALNTLAEGHSVPIDVAAVNGQIFLCNSMFGLPTGFAEQRQHLRGKAALERLQGYIRILRQMLASTRMISIAVDKDGERHRMRALSVVVTSNEYDEVPSLMLTKTAMDRGYLTLYAARHKNGAALSVAVVRAMLGLWKSDPEVEKISATEFTIRMPRRSVRLTNDGEVESFKAPLRYTIRPSSLRVLCPPPAYGT